MCAHKYVRVGNRSLENWPQAWNGRREENKWRSRVCRPWNMGRKSCGVIRSASAHIHFKWSLCNCCHHWQPVQTEQRLKVSANPSILKCFFFFLTCDSLHSWGVAHIPPYPNCVGLVFWFTALLSGVRGKWVEMEGGWKWTLRERLTQRRW